MTNEEVDNKVLAVIRCNISTACAIQRALFPNRSNNGQEYANMRVIDRSLQRLRRAGKIAFVKRERVWSIVGPIGSTP